MGAVRDFFKGIGIISSAGTTISSTGQKLLNLRNELDRIGRIKKR